MSISNFYFYSVYLYYRNGVRPDRRIVRRSGEIYVNKCLRCNILILLIHEFSDDINLTSTSE
jgi:hypothetical protein